MKNQHPKTKSVVQLPAKRSLQEQYAVYKPHFSILLSRLEGLLRNLLKISTTPSFKIRVKDFDSYYRKLLKNPPPRITDDIPILSDIIGVRIICSFLKNLSEVEAILSENFTVLEIERKGADHTFREFGYESIHILLKIPEEFFVGLQLPQGLLLEVQVRTILQDAWAEVEHELIYKSEFSPFDLPLKRKLASINASLSLADIIFQEIRDYQKSLNIELDKRRIDFYARADEFTDTIIKTEEKKTKPLTVPSEEPTAAPKTIDDLILAAIAAQNSNNFIKAEQIYTRILAQIDEPILKSVMYKHRGMTYFAEGDYDAAYHDFVESTKLNPSNFRSYYYVGIALSFLGRSSEAIDQFTKSLDISPYQAHVYFRRALAYYQEGQFVQADKDRKKAEALGMNPEETRKLKIAILNFFLPSQSPAEQFE